MIVGAVTMCFFALHSAWTTEDLSLEREYTSLIVKCFILCVLINLMPVLRDFFSGGTKEFNASAPGRLSGFMAKFKDENQGFAALPAVDGRPAADYVTGRRQTADLVPPPSVTEDTTNLLRNN